MGARAAMINLKCPRCNRIERQLVKASLEFIKAETRFKELFMGVGPGSETENFQAARKEEEEAHERLNRARELLFKHYRKTHPR